MNSSFLPLKDGKGPPHRMNANLESEELIARYLLGELPEKQQVEIEDRAFNDQQYQRLITTVENDLIDEYVRQELPATQRRQFENRFLVSASRRQRVEFARALSTVVSEPASQPVKEARPRSSTWRESLAAFFGGLTPAPRLALVAATLLIFAGVAWLVTQTVRQRAQLARLQQEGQSQQDDRRALEKEITDQRKRNEELTTQLQQEKQQRQQNDELIRQLQNQVNTPSPPQSTIASLLLLPGISRSGGTRPKLVITESARLARLRIGIEPEEPYKTFRVELRSQDGRLVWSGDNLSARPTRAGKSISLTLPATALPPGQYELALKGLTEQRTTEDVGYYYFDVLKK